jgi:hypothetical protein
MINYSAELKKLSECESAPLPGLIELLSIPKESIARLFKAESDSDGNITINPGGRILCIAHRDTVFDNKLPIPRDTGNIILSPALDDRIGIYILMALRESILDITIVITDNEESCNSTARFIKPNDKYIAMVEVDRAMVNDSALYQYLQDPLWADYIESITNLKAEIGTYSDIASVEIGIPGVNLSAGYSLAHSDSCYVIKRDIIAVYANAFKVISELLKNSKPIFFDNKKYDSIASYNARWEEDDKWKSESRTSFSRYYCPNCGREYDRELESQCPHCDGNNYAGIDSPVAGKIILPHESKRDKKRYYKNRNSWDWKNPNKK